MRRAARKTSGKLRKRFETGGEAPVLSGRLTSLLYSVLSAASKPPHVDTHYLSWQSEYSVGVTEIYNQHKEVLNLINYIFSNCSGDRKAELQCFHRVVKVAPGDFRRHFSTEENIMLETHYPKYGEHKAEHDKILESIETAIERIEEHPEELNLLGLAEFLRDWVLSHIPNFDNPTAEYFRRGSDRG
jgi:hemerythrin